MAAQFERSTQPVGEDFRPPSLRCLNDLQYVESQFRKGCDTNHAGARPMMPCLPPDEASIKVNHPAYVPIERESFLEYFPSSLSECPHLVSVLQEP